MIAPVQPVCGWTPSVPHTLLISRYRLACSVVDNELLCAAWKRFPLAEGLERRSSRVAILPALPDTLFPYHACSLSFFGLSATDPTYTWHPWPAHGPFADEVRRWWPSNDWPPAEPPVVIEDLVPDGPPEIIAWRDRGNLLDLVI